MTMSPQMVDAPARSKRRARVARQDLLGTTNGFRDRVARLHRLRERGSPIAEARTAIRRRCRFDGDAAADLDTRLGVPAYLQIQP
jgi:hypothetical protein